MPVAVGKTINLLIDGDYVAMIKSVQDFKEFVKVNYDLLYSNMVRAEDIKEDDEWMQEDEWDEIYQEH